MLSVPFSIFLLFLCRSLCYNEVKEEDGGRIVNYWMIASMVLALAFIAACIMLLCQWKRMRAEREQSQAEAEHLRAENIDLRRELSALEREFEEEQQYSDSLNEEIDAQKEELQRAAERVTQAEIRRTDAEKEIYAGRMRLDQLQQQLKQSHEEQRAQEQLYQDIIHDRDQTITQLQDKLHKRSRKKKPEILDQQITLDDILSVSESKTIQ